MTNLVNNCLFPDSTINSKLIQSLGPQVKEIYTEKGNIPYILIENKKVDKYIIFSHGNGTNIFNSYEFGKHLAKETKYNVVLYDYIGYGISEGDSTENNCYLSLEKIVELVLEKTSESNIYLFGHSLGTGVIIDYVSKNLWTNTIVLISPFLNILSVVNYYLFYFPNFLNKFNSYEKIKNVYCPIKLIHGEFDTLIPKYHSEIIYSKVNNKTFEPTYLNADHNDILYKITPEIYNSIFLKNVF